MLAQRVHRLPVALVLVGRELTLVREAPQRLLLEERRGARRQVWSQMRFASNTKHPPLMNPSVVCGFSLNSRPCVEARADLSPAAAMPLSMNGEELRSPDSPS